MKAENDKINLQCPETSSAKEEPGARQRSEEERVHDIIWNSLNELTSNVEALNKAMDFNDLNPRKLAILVNARSRIQQQIFYCIALLGDPKLKLMTDTGRNRDFARLMKKALLEQNPAVKKLVEEASVAKASEGANS